MSKSYRIRTNPGENGYLKVNLDLKQNYDFLEILSLKISQKDEYPDYCSEYGVVAGRIDINKGFGVPNAKVSIFVPLEESDLDNTLITSLYPYANLITDPDKRNSQGLRYNLLPSQQKKLDHTPVGSFPTKREVLENGTTLEIYEKYYKYTTTTNDAGDYMIFGVPLGQHTIHYDVDVSDIGFISARPYEMIADGYSEELFESKFKFKTSNNLDTLPQIFTANETINVEPYWCDNLSGGSPLGINRKDFSIDVNLTPTAIFTGSIFSDDEKDSLNKNCRPDRDMGKMSEVITGGGKIEGIRRTSDGTIENFEINGDSIDENGNWSLMIPMNLRKVITDEFGNIIPSPDGKKGIPTEADFRFRVSMDKTGNDKRLRQRAHFLVPNMTGNYNFKEYSKEAIENSDDFKINEQLSIVTTNTPYENEKTNEYNYLEEFFTFRWKKVYTVRQYIGRFQKTGRDESRGFIGIKGILEGEGVNKFPANRTDTNFNPLYTILCFLLGLFAMLVGIINGLIQVINGLVTLLCQLRVPVGIRITFTNCSRCAKKMKCRKNAFSSKKMRGCCDETPPGGDDCKDSWKWGISRYPGAKPGYGRMIEGTTAFSCDSLPTPNYEISDAGCDAAFGSSYDELDTDITGDQYETSSCSTSCPGGGLKFKVGSWCRCLKIELKWKCILAPLLCKKCNGYCDGDKHSCCPLAPPQPNGYGCEENPAYFASDISSGGTKCCNDCCIKVPLIKLRCEEENREISPTLFPTPFGGMQCNKTWVVPGMCIGCGGAQTPFIKDWVACKMEPIAVFLKMLKFDFYNDWVGGSLYFPLIKRKYKLKKSKKKFGQIKKDKFCQYNCDDRTTEFPIDEFQGDGEVDQYAVMVRPSVPYGSGIIEISGCKATISAPIVSDWYGEENSIESEERDKATKDIIISGLNQSGDRCQIMFDTYGALTTALSQYTDIQVVPQNRVGPSIYSKPEYVKVTDEFGTETWENVGGFGLHKNKCDRTRMIERGEFFKTELDCLTRPGNIDLDNLDNFGSDGIEIETDPDMNEGDGDDSASDNPGVSGGDLEPGTSACLNGCTSPPKIPTISSSNPECCGSPCGSNGVAGCNLFCPCNSSDIDEYKEIMRHGLITWSNQKLYYSSGIMDTTDKYFNSGQYKANLMLPTTIMELGSTTFCDIDGAPFIMDTLMPTTLQVSMEAVKYKYNNSSSSNPNVRTIKETIDKDGGLNLRSYVSFSCSATECLNTLGVVNQSQVGVEMIDTNNIDVSIGNCFMRFDHDVDVREYFCRRFSGYKDNNLKVHYISPSGDYLDNQYTEYPELKLSDGLTYVFQEDNDSVVSEYNDADYFVPGDACGFKKESGNEADYFYGIAPGVTNQLTDFPNTTTLQFPTTELNETIDTPVGGLKGIRFNNSQTPYHLYFGIVPGKTSLHKTVGKFFADKINVSTLQGLGNTPDQSSANEFGRNNIRNQVDSPYSILKTCLGQTQLPDPPTP